MLPAPQHKRSLTSIYAPRSIARKKRIRSMLDDLPARTTLSPFHPLPAIGEKKTGKETKLYVLDLNSTEPPRPATVEDRAIVLKSLSPLRIRCERVRCNSVERINVGKPQQLVRENTYDVIEPIFLKMAKVKKRDSSRNRQNNSENENESSEDVPKRSPRSRFRKAALDVAKLTSVPETGKLLCLREKQTNRPGSEDDEYHQKRFPVSPTRRLNRLSELFQNLDMKGHQRDKVKKENSWF